MSTLLLVCAGLVMGVGFRLLLPMQKLAEFQSVPLRRRGRTAESGARRRKPNEINDAIASWTEHLRDSLGSAGGLESAIMSSGELAPRVIRAEVERLAADTKYLGAEKALLRFANSLNTSQSDLVIAALVTATRFQSRDLVGLLTQLADCAREESKMNLRIWVSRARIRSSVRIVMSSVGLFIGGLVMFNRSYLVPFTTPDGVAVLLVLTCLFTIAIWLLIRMTRVAAPVRFVARGESDEVAA
ncbi:MAG: hypothetical protein RLZ84_896 [Actinomycetota bacterium]|jgi:tight adherence protein B